MQEIFILTKHANFSAQYVENLPTWKRRYYINLLEQEVEQIKEKHESESRKISSRARSPKRR